MNDAAQQQEKSATDQARDHLIEAAEHAANTRYQQAFAEQAAAIEILLTKVG